MRVDVNDSVKTRAINCKLSTCVLGRVTKSPAHSLCVSRSKMSDFHKKKKERKMMSVRDRAIKMVRKYGSIIPLIECSSNNRKEFYDVRAITRLFIRHR